MWTVCSGSVRMSCVSYTQTMSTLTALSFHETERSRLVSKLHSNSKKVKLCVFDKKKIDIFYCRIGRTLVYRVVVLLYLPLLILQAQGISFICSPVFSFLQMSFLKVNRSYHPHGVGKRAVKVKRKPASKQEWVVSMCVCVWPLSCQICWWSHACVLDKSSYQK